MSFNFNDLKITNSIKREAIISSLLSFPKDLINPEIDGINQKIQGKINANSSDPNLNTIMDEYVDKIHEQLIIKKNVFIQQQPVVELPVVVPVPLVVPAQNPDVHPFDVFRNRRINRIETSIMPQIIDSSEQTPIETPNKILKHYRHNLLLRQKALN
jgi:hypothetical protein